MNTVTTSSPHSLYPGMEVTFSGFSTEFFPHWVTTRWFQDGDRMLVRWFYGLVGWDLHSFKAGIGAVDSTTFTF